MSVVLAGYSVKFIFPRIQVVRRLAIDHKSIPLRMQNFPSIKLIYSGCMLSDANKQIILSTTVIKLYFIKITIRLKSHTCRYSATPMLHNVTTTIVVCDEKFKCIGYYIASYW